MLLSLEQVVNKVMFQSLRAKCGNLQLLWGSNLETAKARKARLALTIATFFNSLLNAHSTNQNCNNMLLRPACQG